MQPGDVIETVNGQKVTNPRELAVDVASLKPGDEAHLDVLHDGQNKDVALKVAQLPNEQTASNGESGGAASASSWAWRWRRCRRTCAASSTCRMGTRGAVVRGVQPGSPAEQAGLQPGDVIVGVGTHPVTSPAEAAQRDPSAR